MGPSAYVGIFCKAPVPGRVKTRLSVRLGPDRAASLYTAFLVDTVTLALESTAAGVLVFHDGPPPTGALPGFPSGAGLEEIRQGKGDLGVRLARATFDAAERDRLPVVLLGSDSPDLPAEYLEDALDAVRRYDVVLGPATDGGAWCIGVARPIEGLFGGLPWSQPTTGSALRNRVAELGLKLRMLEEWADVDHPEDLDSLTHRLRSGQAVAPATLAWITSSRKETDV